MSSSPSRPTPKNLASPSTSESSTQATPLPRSPRRYNGPPTTHNPNSFELQPVSPRQDRASKEDIENEEEEGLLPGRRRSSLGSVQSYELYTPDEDQAVVKKLDRKLVVFMAFMYMLCFLDRTSE